MPRFRNSSFLQAIFVVLIASFFGSWDEHACGEEGTSLRVGRWTDHGLGASSKLALERRIDESVRDGEVPGGAILIMHRGEVIFHRGFGWGHIRKQIPFEKDAQFRAASLTKPVLATLVVALHGKGIVDLDRPIDHWLPGAIELRKNSGQRPATIPTLRQCLSHTAGFRSDYYSRALRPWLVPENRGRSLDEVVAAELAIPMAQDPGVKYSYSGIGFDMAGRVVEIATGRSIEEVLQSELWQPLGMSRTTLYPSKKEIQVAPHFYWLHRSDGGFRRSLDRRFVPPGTYTSLGGGMISTVTDLARFLNLHRGDGGDLIDAASLDRMDDPQPGSRSYGLGFNIGPNTSHETGDYQAASIRHTGSSGTLFWLDRERDLIVVIATQHRMCNGGVTDEKKWAIPAGTLSWQQRLQRDWIDPIFADMKIAPHDVVRQSN